MNSVMILQIAQREMTRYFVTFQVANCLMTAMTCTNISQLFFNLALKTFLAISIHDSLVRSTIVNMMSNVVVLNFISNNASRFCIEVQVQVQVQIVL